MSGGGGPGRAAERSALPSPVAATEMADIAPCRTSIYVGTVSLTPARMRRTAAGYDGDYSVSVFPWAFYNERGRLSVEVSEADLRRLAAGEVIRFQGRALNHRQKERRVEAKATPETPARGKLRVSVFVGETELVFHTTYLFPSAEKPPGAA